MDHAKQSLNDTKTLISSGFLCFWDHWFTERLGVLITIAVTAPDKRPQQAARTASRAAVAKGSARREAAAYKSKAARHRARTGNRGD